MANLFTNIFRFLKKRKQFTELDGGKASSCEDAAYHYGRSHATETVRKYIRGLSGVEYRKDFVQGFFDELKEEIIPYYEGENNG